MWRMGIFYLFIFWIWDVSGLWGALNPSPSGHACAPVALFSKWPIKCANPHQMPSLSQCCAASWHAWMEATYCSTECPQVDYGTLDINQTALCFPVRIWMPKCQKSQPDSLKWEELLFGEPRAKRISSWRELGPIVSWLSSRCPLPKCPLSKQRLQ